MRRFLFERGYMERCKCGQPVRYAPPENRCEDCFARDQQKWPGWSQRVKTTNWPENEKNHKTPRTSNQ